MSIQEISLEVDKNGYYTIIVKYSDRYLIELECSALVKQILLKSRLKYNTGNLTRSFFLYNNSENILCPGYEYIDDDVFDSNIKYFTFDEIEKIITKKDFENFSGIRLS